MTHHSDKYIIQELQLPGVKQIIPATRFADERGYFAELYREDEMTALGFPRFVQDNLSLSSRGVFRGMHLQAAPYGQAKLIRVLSGKIIDFVLDVDPTSPYFRQKVAVELSEENNQLLFIPPQYAHGFLALEDHTRVLYKVDTTYTPSAERAYHYTELLELIESHLPTSQLIISSKDLSAPRL